MNAALAELLGQLEFDPAALASTSGMPVRTPIDGAVLAHVAIASARDADEAIARAKVAQATWRAVPAPRRGELRPPLRRRAARSQGAAGRAGHAGNRQAPAGRRRRGAGDDRHLRLRGGSLAPAARPHDRVRASRAPDDGDVASLRRLRRDLGLQLSGGRVGVERGARLRLRQRGGVEAVGEDAAHRVRSCMRFCARTLRAFDPAFADIAQLARSAIARWARGSSSIRTCGWSARPARPRWAARSAPPADAR